MDREVALEALSVVCNAKVTSIQRQRSDGDSTGGATQPSITRLFKQLSSTEATQPLLSIRQLIPTVLIGDETCPVARSNFARIHCGLFPGAPMALTAIDFREDETGKLHVIDEDDFFDEGYDFDFRHLKDTATYHRGGEVYERPCGWYRFALKVLDKYDKNTWLGTQYRTTESVPGEWPVSYHGTSQEGAEGIIEGHYKPGTGQVYGRGIYSTPYISEAVAYSKTFTSKKTKKRYRVILQNRINPKYREKHNNDKYWLVPIPKGKSEKEEEELVERAIRPYGLLLKEV